MGTIHLNIIYTISEFLDEFLAKFLRVNEKACNKRWKQ